MKRFVVPLLLVALAACGQPPAPDVAPDLAAQVFGSSRQDAALGLAKHRTGVFAVGRTNGNLHAASRGDNDAFIRRYSASGTVLWGRQFGTAASDGADGVASDGGDNAYVVGSTTGSLAGSSGYQDVFLRKYTPAGLVSWTRQFGTPSDDYPGDVAVSGGSVYIVGHTEGALAGRRGGWDVFVRKYNVSGVVVWTRQFGTPDDDFAHDVAVDGSGNVYVVGDTLGSLAGPNGGGRDLFVRKYSASGADLWTRQRHYSDGDFADAVAASGSNVHIVGTFLYGNHPDDPDVRVLKYSASGSLVWDRAFGLKGQETAYDVKVDGGGNVYFAGSAATAFAATNRGGYDGYTVKLSRSGTWLWGKGQGTRAHDATYALQAQASSGDLYAAGGTQGVLGGGNRGGEDAFLRRLVATSGGTLWTDQ